MFCHCVIFVKLNQNVKKKKKKNHVINVLTLTDFRVPDVSHGVLVEQQLALLAVDADGVVHAVIAHPSADQARRLVPCSVKVTLGGMVVAVALWTKKRIIK